MTHDTDTDTGPDSALAHGEHFADLNGFTMHYTVRGHGPVLLVPSPGWGPAVRSYIPLPGLEERCTVVYFDTRHSGESTGPEDGTQYTLDHFVGDIDALREHLGQARVFLAGHSAAGHQALAYGIAHSDHLFGIIAIDANVAPDDVRARELLARVEDRRDRPYYLQRPGMVDTALAVLTDDREDGPSADEVLDAIGTFYFHDPELAADFLGAMAIDPAVRAYASESGFQTDDLLPDLGRITVPTLLLYGDDDFICDPVTQGGRAHRAMSTARLVVVESAGHVPWVEQPDAFVAACHAWFDDEAVTTSRG